MERLLSLQTMKIRDRWEAMVIPDHVKKADEGAFAFAKRAFISLFYRSHT
jgi:hypothetical protein